MLVPDNTYILTPAGELCHWGIKGMKWGVRRYQNPDGSLTPAGQKRLMKKDARWARKNMDKITRKARKASSKELNQYSQELLRLPDAFKTNGKLSSKTINAYNRRMAELMNEKVSGVSAPSGRIVQFVAKRGEIGVHMALTTAGYDMSQYKNGIYGSGKIAYKNENANVMRI